MAYIGVDLDGTLAHYDPNRSAEEIGPPIPRMMARVKDWLARGIEVRIITARASYPPYIPLVEKWLEENGLPGLKVTNKKDFGMLQLWDDRAIQVVENTGMPVNRIGTYGDPNIEPLHSPTDQIEVEELAKEMDQHEEDE